MISPARAISDGGKVATLMSALIGDTNPLLPTHSLPPASLLQDRDHLLESAPLRERERCVARPIGKIDVRARFHECLEHRDMTFAAVAEHNRLDQRGPAQIMT